MKAAYLVSSSPSFEDDLWRAAEQLGWQVGADGAQTTDAQGRVVTVQGGLGEDGAEDWREDLVASPGLDELPDLGEALAVLVECRAEDLFAASVALLAQRLPHSAWVVDGDGVVWPAAHVDADAVQL